MLKPREHKHIKNFKLNQRHWLNIIILSISLMLVLSLLVGRMMNSPVKPQILKLDDTSAVNQSHKIVQIDFGEIQFNRIGNDWVVVNGNYENDKLLAIIEHWYALIQGHGKPINQQLKSGKTVLIYLSNVKQPVIARLALTDENLRISFINQNLEFYLPAEEIKFYYPH